MHMMQKKTRTPKRKNRVRKSQDLTTACERETDETCLGGGRNWKTFWTSQDVEDLRELSESMNEGLPHHQRKNTQKLREEHGEIAVISLPRQPLLTQLFGSRHASLSGTGREKGKTRPKGGSVHQKKLLTRCFNCKPFFGQCLVIRFIWQKTNTMRRHILRVVI